jgi:hypothetical protein
MIGKEFESLPLLCALSLAAALLAGSAAVAQNSVRVGAPLPLTGPLSLDPPVFQLQGGKPVVIFPDYIKQAEFKFGVQG